MRKLKLFRNRCHVHETRISGSFFKIGMILISSTCSTLLFAADVEMSKFDAVSTKVSTNIIVTVTPSPGMEKKVCLSLHTIEGIGGAVFLPGGHTSTNILQTKTLRIIGNQLSSVDSNMVLEAKVGETVVASNVFTVVDMISESKAIEIAIAAIKGKMKTQKGASITAELKGRDYIVTFGWTHPKGITKPMLAPSYTAKVTLDAFTGSVKQILGAP